MTLLRSAARPALIVGGAWFLSALISGSFDTLFLVLILLGLVVGVAWPGGARAVAVGIGAVAGNLAASLLTSAFDPRSLGGTFPFYSLAFLAIATSVHGIGTIAREFDARALGRLPGSDRGTVLSVAVLIGTVWFLLYGQQLWMDALGLADIPGEELFALTFVVAIGTGLAWPGVGPSIAAGVAGLVGALAGLSLTGQLADVAGTGFSLWWLSFFTAPTAAHALGTALRGSMRRQEVAAA